MDRSIEPSEANLVSFNAARMDLDLVRPTRAMDPRAPRRVRAGLFLGKSGFLGG